MKTIALVSCVKSKRTVKNPAKDMYVSTLFKGLRRYAEQHADEWYILSAKYGVLLPTTVIEPYELTLKRMNKARRIEWGQMVVRQLRMFVFKGSKVIFLAGLPYREYIIPFLDKRKIPYEIPLEGLGIGEQLSWLKKQGSAFQEDTETLF